MTPNLWHADHVDLLSRFSQSELEVDQSLMAEWVRWLPEEGIANVTDMLNEDQSIVRLARLLGSIDPSVGRTFKLSCINAIRLTLPSPLTL